MNRTSAVGCAFLVVLFVASSCSQGSGDRGAGAHGGEFVVLRTTPVDNGLAYLNDPIRIDFSASVDPDSASFTTVAFHVFDNGGNPLSASVTGRFHVGTSPGDSAPGRQLLFLPHLPTDNHFLTGGLRADRAYIVHLVGGVAHNGTTLRSVMGTPLRAPISFRFSTTRGTSPAQLFRNPRTGGPRRLPVGGLIVSSAGDLERVPLNLLGGPPAEVRLVFDQALNPHDQNVPVAFDSNPLVRSIHDRGRIFLEYDDPVAGNNTWLPADVAIERNDLDGATVVLRPVGVLPNNAAIRVIVENTVEDISGESNVADLAYNRVFGTFRTARAYEQQWNGAAEDFTSTDGIDFGAVFAEPLAEVGHGYIKAGFAFEGSGTTLDFQPTLSEVILNTVFTQVVPHEGLPFNVSGGVFNFRNVTIPQGCTVRGQGGNPMVWLCNGDFRVAGTLSVSGGEGERVMTITAAHWPKAGGIAACGGGAGGPGSPSATQRDLRGGAGQGAMQVPGLGGLGGRLSCLSGCGIGSGGGGGTLATQGDPWYRAPATTGTLFQQRRGIGGMGCYGPGGARSAVLQGGEAGSPVFTDARADNDFWGAGTDFAGNRRVTGELTAPAGGSGGGGGGDLSSTSSCQTNDPSFSWDASGAGGGAGGGVLIVKALGEIEVTSTGRIVANGGNGGGGEWVGSCSQGGGGGGGAGGLVVLMSSKRIVLHTHGTSARWTYAQNDYDFVISADGGTCSVPGTAEDKYPAGGQPMAVGSSYDAVPRGGLGGMGIVQLMAPSGDNATDGTNTRLDDNIVVFRNGVPQNGAEKQAILAWRGFQNAVGVFVDDAGNPTNIGNDEGDIRPAPVLLPAPYSARSRLRSKWIDTGASQRRPIPSDDGLPRGIVLDGTSVVGPVYEFAGLQTSGSTAGYLAYEPIGLAGVQLAQPIVVPPIDVDTTDASASYLGSPAYAMHLVQPLAAPDDRHRLYEAELLDAAGLALAGFRILSHAGSRVLLAPDGKALPAGIVRLRVRARFFRVVTSSIEGLGPVHLPGGATSAIPRANVRIGFAFHRDPAGGASGRYPLDPQTFVHDLAEPGFASWIQQNGAPRYVQWDVTFHTTYSTVPPLGPDSPRPELHFLRLPFRF